LWNHHYKGTWQAIEGFNWSPQALPVVEALGEKLRSSMLALLGEAYSTVSPAKAAALLGVSESQALWLAEVCMGLNVISTDAQLQEQQGRDLKRGCDGIPATLLLSS